MYIYIYTHSQQDVPLKFLNWNKLKQMNTENRIKHVDNTTEKKKIQKLHCINRNVLTEEDTGIYGMDMWTPIRPCAYTTQWVRHSFPVLQYPPLASLSPTHKKSGGGSGGLDVCSHKPTAPLWVCGGGELHHKHTRHTWHTHGPWLLRLLDTHVFTLRGSSIACFTTLFQLRMFKIQILVGKFDLSFRHPVQNVS